MRKITVLSMITLDGVSRHPVGRRKIHQAASNMAAGLACYGDELFDHSRWTNLG